MNYQVLFTIFVLSVGQLSCQQAESVDDDEDTGSGSESELGTSSQMGSSDSNSDAGDSETDSDTEWVETYDNPICGSGVVLDVSSRKEACDDGNQIGGDGCAADCREVEAGWLCPPEGGECQFVAVCGDFVVSYPEQCDDGNLEDGDSCPADCNPDTDCGGQGCTAVCGDGILGPGEQCDDGVNSGGYNKCSPGCVLHEYCGDGIIQEEYENCDDENLRIGDDCPSYCYVVELD